MKISTKEVKKTKAEALEKIKQFLEAEDVDGQFADRSGDYYSKDKFIVSWNANYKGMPAEFSINKSDSFYTAYSGYKATYTTQGLCHEKQLEGYHSIERALCEVGMKLCPKAELKAFFDKYVVKYNNRINKEKTENNEQSND